MSGSSSPSTPRWIAKLDRQSAVDLILDHYQNPRHRGVIENPDLSGEGVNEGCGDIVKLTVSLDGEDRITAIRFDGQGCTISQAAASLVTEMAKGKPLAEVLAWDQAVLADQLGQDIITSRPRCATLALDVLKDSARRRK